MERPAQPQSAWIGPGLSYRRRYHQALLSLTERERVMQHGRLVLEILPDHFFANSAPLEALAEQYCLVFHDVGLSIATVGSNDRRQQRLRQLKALVALAKPVLFSDHLAMTSSPEGFDCGHLAPVWYTEEVLHATSDHIRRCQDMLETPFALENIAAPLFLPAPMSEPVFLTRLVERTGCGLLLDLANLLYNQRNFPHQTVDWLQRYPLHAVQQLHLAGGTYRHGRWIDSHSTAVEAAAFALLQDLPACPAVKTIVIERDSALPGLTTLLSEAHHAAHLWQRRRHGALA